MLDRHRTVPGVLRAMDASHSGLIGNIYPEEARKHWQQLHCGAILCCAHDILHPGAQLPCGDGTLLVKEAALHGNIKSRIHLASTHYGAPTLLLEVRSGAVTRSLCRLRSNKAAHTQ